MQEDQDDSHMKALDRNIWRSSKIRLYNVYILPILLYGADTWSMASSSSRGIDALDQWCLRHILHISCIEHVTNDEVRRRSCHPPANFLSRRNGCVCSATLLEPVHLRTICVLFERPSVVSVWTGNAHLVEVFSGFWDSFGKTKVNAAFIDPKPVADLGNTGKHYLQQSHFWLTLANIGKHNFLPSQICNRFFWKM